MLLFIVFIIYTVLLLRKHDILNDNKHEFLQCYDEFIEKYERDEYYTKNEYNNWRDKHNYFKRTIGDYKHHIERIMKYRNKIKPFKKIIDDYLNIFRVSQEYEKKINNLHKLFNNGLTVINLRNKAFIEKELETNNEFFNNQDRLSARQRRTIITDEDNNLVVTGTETDITPTIVGKTRYILEKGYAKPEEILLLTFDAKAKDELEEKIIQYTGIHARTFHDFGNEIIEQASDRLPSLHNTAWDDTVLQKTMEGFVKNHIMDPKFANLVNQYFDYYLNPMGNPYEFETKEEINRYLKKLKLPTFRGELVKSPAELSIANFFYFNNVNYLYTQEYTIGTYDDRHGLYKPDFTLSDHNIWIEHIEIDANCNTGPDTNRDEYMDLWYWKRKIHEKNNTELIETYGYEHQEDTLIESLREKLLVRGVKYEPKSKKEIFKRLSTLGDVTAFTSLLIKFLSLYKSSTLSFHEIEEKARNHLLSQRYVVFLELFKTIYQDYELLLRDSGSIDFEDVIYEAISRIEKGEYKSKFKYILVDGFQDISQSRIKLLTSLIKQKPDTKTFFVGHEWRSIGFTGSSLSLVTIFERYFVPFEIIMLDETLGDNEQTLKRELAKTAGSSFPWTLFW